jgi:ATP-dependent Clp protease protease subunit
LLTADEPWCGRSAAQSACPFRQPSGGFQGQATDILIHAKEVESLKRRLNEIYVKHTGRAYEDIHNALERDNFMTADQAKDFGLIDKVIDKRAEESTPAKPA